MLPYDRDEDTKQRIYQYVEAHPRATTVDLKSGVVGRSSRIAALAAQLGRDGYLDIEVGPAGAQFHTVAKPYRNTIKRSPVTRPQQELQIRVPVPDGMPQDQRDELAAAFTAFTKQLIGLLRR